ncbi:MAG: cytochrome c oxidase assembly protein [Alphaproteobacteria bacterium]
MHKNTQLLVLLFAIALAMLGVAYAFVPLYRIFCQHFGIPVPKVLVGQQGPAALFEGTSDRTITIRFVANNAQGMPVTLAPEISRLTVRLGEPTLTAFTATNTAPRAVDGVAVHTLLAMGGLETVSIDEYVDLQQCFCFEQQRYPAKQDVHLPLSFTISPQLPVGIHTITFGYTLFEEKNTPVTKDKP